MADDEITEEQAREIVRQFSEGKETTTSFFTHVVAAKDTTKTGYLSEEELGNSNNTLRAYKELELFSRDVCNNDKFADYFKGMAEIQTSTSLSKDGFLLKQVNLNRKELADMTPKRKNKKGLFKKKDENEES